MTDFDDDVVDGSGLTVREAARRHAEQLALDEEQTAGLVAELRNALAPVYRWHPSRNVYRILALAEELAKRHGAS